jgi:hypothetical protein
MNEQTFKELWFPDDYVPGNVDWLEERLKKLEDETLKDATAILGKVAAGVAGCIAASAAIMAARDTLFVGVWGSHFHVGGDLYLGYRFYFAFLALFEIVAIASAFHQFRLAYEPIKMQMAPDYADGGAIAGFLQLEAETLRASFLIATQCNINHNRAQIADRNSHISKGFLDLFIAMSLVLIHAVWSAILKYAS